MSDHRDLLAASRRLTEHTLALNAKQTPAQKTAEEIEAELVKRIGQLTCIAKIGGKRSAAKFNARANELAELLGWARGSAGAARSALARLSVDRTESAAAAAWRSAAAAWRSAAAGWEMEAQWGRRVVRALLENVGCEDDNDGARRAAIIEARNFLDAADAEYEEQNT